MEKSKKFFYIYLPFIFLSLLIHFLLFVNINSCKVFNTGFAFGIGDGMGLTTSVIINIVTILMVMLGGIFIKGYRYPLLLIFLLSIGNLTDRLYGGVCDYIDISKLLSFKIPIFNLLDLGIVIGICLIIIDIIKDIWKK